MNVCLYFISFRIRSQAARVALEGVPELPVPTSATTEARRLAFEVIHGQAGLHLIHLLANFPPDQPGTRHGLYPVPSPRYSSQTSASDILTAPTLVNAAPPPPADLEAALFDCLLEVLRITSSQYSQEQISHCLSSITSRLAGVTSGMVADEHHNEVPFESHLPSAVSYLLDHFLPCRCSLIDMSVYERVFK